MKVSRDWLQTYFEKPLPGAETLAEALTFHAFEIESVEGDILDVKVLPDRAGYALSHRGIAYELSAILDQPLKADPLRAPEPQFPNTGPLTVDVDERYVLRHTGALVRGVTVGESPSWLKERLEALGQRSINNVVDVLNYVLLDIGQPSGAFDAGKMELDNGALHIAVREARAGEKIKVLTGEEYELSENMFVFTDARGMLLDIAGIKGGLDSGITGRTKDIFLSVGNYDGTLIRASSQKLKLATDASHRYQNRPSPELTAYGMQAILALFKKIGVGGTLIGVHDAYPRKPESHAVSVTAEKVSRHLGAPYADTDVIGVLRRLTLPFVRDGDAFVVTPPFERNDLVVPEDIVEEVGRILGYDRVPATELPATAEAPDQRRFRGVERMKDQLIEQGFTEVSTQSFTKKGDVYLANPLDKTRPALRKTLEETLAAALAQAKQYAPLVLPPNAKPKLFEVGTVFPKEGEYVELRTTEAAGEGVPTRDNLTRANLEEYGADYEPKHYELGPYRPFSAYPFVLRDIALWVPSDTDERLTKSIIKTAAGELLHRIDHFDRFEKDGKVSYAFRLVFQSFERTLSDEAVNGVMEKVNAAVEKEGWRVR